jgi:hypothetical protein
MRHQDICPEISTKQFSAAGLVADATDRHLVTQAQRYLAEGSA